MNFQSRRGAAIVSRYHWSSSAISRICRRRFSSARSRRHSSLAATSGLSLNSKSSFLKLRTKLLPCRRRQLKANIVTRYTSYLIACAIELPEFAKQKEPNWHGVKDNFSAICEAEYWENVRICSIFASPYISSTFRTKGSRKFSGSLSMDLGNLLPRRRWAVAQYIPYTTSITLSLCAKIESFFRVKRTKQDCNY